MNSKVIPIPIRPDIEDDFVTSFMDLSSRFYTPVPVTILVENRDNKGQKTGEMKPMSKHVTVSSVAKVISGSASDRETTPQDPTNDITIPLTTIYDTQNHLSEILIAKLQRDTLPRVTMQLLALILPKYHHLSHFTIKNCRIDMYVVHELGKMLPFTTITDVCLDCCPLTKANYEELLHNTCLKNLSLCRCNITDEVCERLAETLHYLKSAENSLVTLNLSSNCIGDEGARYLANALRSNRHLRYLNLADNHISDEGASLILNILTEFPLTKDEDNNRRKRFMVYLKNKNELNIKNLNNLGLQKSAASIHSSTSKLRSNGKMHVMLPPRRTQSSLSRGSQIKRIPTKKMSAKSFTPSTVTLIENLPKKTESKAEDLLGPFVDPFCPNSLRFEEYPRCRGNFVLCYLNLAYNDITYLSVRKLLSVVEYQKNNSNPDACGLLKVILDGNLLPVTCTELVTIQKMLNQNVASFQDNKASKQFVPSKGSPFRNSHARN